MQQLVDEQDFICEAGTGTGKTLAYLLPTLQVAEKVIVSTATKTLQRQLLIKDIAIGQQVMGGGIKAFLLKGKENYLSPKRLEQTLANSPQLDAVLRRQLAKAYAWAKKTTTGDRSDCSELADSAPIWRLICNRSQDELESNSFYSQARNQAKEAQLLIVNHHLLCAELINLRDRQFSLIKDFKAIVVDEAHHLQAIAAQMLSQRISSYQLHETVKECNQSLAFFNAEKRQPFVERINALSNQIHQLQQATQQDSLQRRLWNRVNNPRIEETIQHLINLNQQLLDLFLPLIEADAETEEDYQASIKLLESNTQFFTQLANAQANGKADDKVAWFESHQNNHFSIHLTPLAIAEEFSQLRQGIAAQWIYTSATLAVDNQFDHFCQSLGIHEQTPTLQLSSPFNFKQQVVWYQPDTAQFRVANGYLKQAFEVCQLTKGNAFLLFCSYRALQQAKEFFMQHPSRQSFNLLCQGDANNQTLIKQFKAKPNAVLLGTSSFWEGVDIRGDALRFVAIDKLPFANPSDPVMQAKEQWYRRRQQNLFSQESLPKAIISLRQGLGRLIRDTSDIGIVMIGDDRLYSRSYGQQFINSMPNYHIVENWQVLQRTWYNMRVQFEADFKEDEPQ